MTAPILFLGWGNPSRGDDAIGPLLCDRLTQLLTRSDLAAIAGRTEVEQDFQLQIEDASDLLDRDLVVFIDASVAASAPFALTRLDPREDVSTSSHALSPEAVLAVTRKIFGKTPLCYLMAVRGESFDLGEGLSSAARLHVEAAWRALREIALADDPPAVAALIAQPTAPALAAGPDQR